jgi:ferredoxin
MTIFYFTSTGNGLAVAKKISGQCGVAPNLVSIPQIIDSPAVECSDDTIGIIFPIYGFYCPKMVRRFLERAKLAADYIFAIGTYGNKEGACMRNVQRKAAELGIRVDYAKALLMVDNYLPGFDVDDQISKLPQKKTDEKLASIIADIAARKKLAATASVGDVALAAAIQAGENTFMKATMARNYIIDAKCAKCGTCAKTCPSGNISVADRVAFADKCEWCLGCVHLCPKNAIHLKNERSSKRWRHPDVSLAEIIKSNDRTAAQ